MNLTVITAVHDRIDGLRNVLRCLDDQTNQEFEHIIVDDFSTEIDYNGLEELCSSRPRTKFVRLGFRSHFYGCFARDIGTILAFCYVHHSKRDIDNEWVAYLDTDNEWAPNHISSAADAALRSPFASVVASDAEWVGATDKNWHAIKECKLRHGGLDIGQLFYKTALFRKYGYWFAHPKRKHKYDIELIERIVAGEGAESVVFTGLPTFKMSYRKR